MLARLLRISVVSSLLAACGWPWLSRSSPIWLTWAGFWSIPVVQGFVLGHEFVLARLVNQQDPTPEASSGQFLRAWIAELFIALKVFGWRMPFRSRVCTDQWKSAAPGQRGVILIHGFVCNRGIWMPWLGVLRAQGNACAALNLKPAFPSIDHYAAQIENAVTWMTTATGRTLVLVCHSLGGLAARAWLRAAGLGAEQRVCHITTLATPHHGTWMGRFSISANAFLMRHMNPWARQLMAEEPISRATRFTRWYSNCDNMAFPASTGKLAGAGSRFAPGLAHVQLALDPRVMRACLEKIRAT